MITREMVEATQVQGDGVERPYQYATFRTDKEPTPGYSRELISVSVPAEFYDNLEGQLPSWERPDLKTLMDAFKANVNERGAEPFLVGTRDPRLERRTRRGSRCSATTSG